MRRNSSPPTRPPTISHKMQAYTILIPIIFSYLTLLIIIYRQTISPPLLVTSLLILTLLSLLCIVCLHLSHLIFQNIYFQLRRGSFDATNYPIDDLERQTNVSSNGWDQDQQWTIDPTPWEATPQEESNPPPTPKSGTTREEDTGNNNNPHSNDSDYTLIP